MILFNKKIWWMFFIVIGLHTVYFPGDEPVYAQAGQDRGGSRDAARQMTQIDASQNPLLYIYLVRKGRGDAVDINGGTLVESFNYMMGQNPGSPGFFEAMGVFYDMKDGDATIDSVLNEKPVQDQVRFYEKLIEGEKHEASVGGRDPDPKRIIDNYKKLIELEPDNFKYNSELAFAYVSYMCINRNESTSRVKKMLDELTSVDTKLLELDPNNQQNSKGIHEYIVSNIIALKDYHQLK